MPAAGYAHADYAASLSEFGQPVFLPLSRGWLLQRHIDGTEFSDAMGPYPLFFCGDWSHLSEDLSALASHLVSVVAVIEPFANLNTSTLATAFDRIVPFKDHYVADLDELPESFVHKSHQAHARRSLRSVTVEVCDYPPDHLEDWLRLFAILSGRHSISGGVRSFSRFAFDSQFRIPGLVMFKASADDEVVGLDLWFMQGDVAYGHLAAFSDVGYQLHASYATKWTMLNYFRGRVRWVDLAGTFGTSARENDGLAAFKRGWSTGTKTAYLCGRVLQPEIYETLTQREGKSEVRYFPGYRAGEFA